MKFTYKHKNRIVIITLAFIFIILLRALNYQIWDSSYTKGNFQKIIFKNAGNIEQYIVAGETSALNTSDQHLVSRTIFTHFDFVGFAGISSFYVASAMFLIFLTHGYFLNDTKNTLVSLCVRMNN